MPEIRCVAVGDPLAGKSSLLSTAFSPHGLPALDNPGTSIIYSTMIVSTSLDSVTSNVHLWETNGSDEYDQLRPMMYPEANVFLITFSITSPSSFQHIRTKWLPELKRLAPEGIPILLVGTKGDLRRDANVKQHLNEEKEVEIVTREEATALTDEIHAVGGYFECSSVTRDGVIALFEEAIRAARRSEANVRDLKKAKKKREEKEKAIASSSAIPTKLVFISDGATGVSSLIQTYVTGAFPINLQPNETGITTKTSIVDEKRVELRMIEKNWNSQHRQAAYTDSDCILLCFDVDGEEGFAHIKSRWLPELQKYASGVPLLLIGMKGDRRSDEAWITHLKSNKCDFIEPEAAKECAKEIGAVLYIECSAREMICVTELFEMAVRLAMQKKKEKSCTIQ